MPPQYETRDIPPRHNPWIVPLSIVIAGAFIGAGIYFSKVATPQVALNNGKKTIGDININPVIASDHILGNPNATVTIVEFSDTECPFCKEFEQTMQQIMSTYGKTGQVAWVYRHFPIDALHKRAHHEAVATECANELGGVSKFWDYLNAVFSRTTSNDTLDPLDLPDIAKELGLDQKKFNNCLGSTKYDNLILQQSQDAVRAGANGTPFSVLITSDGNKLAIKGAEPYDVMKTLIDTALSQGVGSETAPTGGASPAN
jgi:protein-disulfide isomerase